MESDNRPSGYGRECKKLNNMGVRHDLFPQGKSGVGVDNEGNHTGPFQDQKKQLETE